MSFILDALKKSESERQRQSGPALFEVKVATARGRLPPWALALAALLVVNLAVIGWLVLRGPAPPAAASAAPAGAAAPQQSEQRPAAPAPAPVATSQPLTATAAPGALAPGTAAPGTEGAAVVAGAQGPAPAPAFAQQGYAVQPQAGAAPGPVLAADPLEVAGEINPQDYEPAVAAAPPRARAASGVVRGHESGLPSYEDVALAPGSSVPELRLDLHVYSERPQERFVLINMRRLREGDSLPGGVRVESITADGAILSWRNSRFLLQRD